MNPESIASKYRKLHKSLKNNIPNRPADRAAQFTKRPKVQLSIQNSHIPRNFIREDLPAESNKKLIPNIIPLDK